MALLTSCGDTSFGYTYYGAHVVLRLDLHLLLLAHGAKCVVVRIVDRLGSGWVHLGECRLPQVAMLGSGLGLG